MDFILQGVSLVSAPYQGRDAVRVTMPASATQDPAKEALSDRDYMAWLDTDFGDGTIEVDLASELAPDAPDYARGFIGLAFRIDRQNRFESIYLRPVNAQVDDPVRRNRSVQYVAYPDFPFPRLRVEEPDKYETYADIAMGRWISMRLEVVGETVRLFLDGEPTPVLVVSDMKLGSSQRGGVGLWIEAGTVGYFSNLIVTPRL